MFFFSIVFNKTKFIEKNQYGLIPNFNEKLMYIGNVTAIVKKFSDM